LWDLIKILKNYFLTIKFFTMKKLHLTILFLLFTFNLLLFSQIPDEPCVCETSCENFENNSIGNWTGLNALVDVKTTTTQPTNSYLELEDDTGGSWVYNDVDYAGDYSVGNHCLCWDYKIFDDGFNNTINVRPTIRIYRGTNPATGIAATFTASFSITENDDWIRICVPLGPAVGSLPSNENGAWGGLTVQAWNDLMHDVDGIAFVVDLAGSSSPTEKIGIDDICLCDACGDVNAPAFITTDANGNPKQEFCDGEDVFIKIDPVNYSYPATYLDTWLDPNCSTDWYNGAGWNYDISSGIYNYSQILRDKGQPPFKPTDDYYVKLAVNHPNCGWVESHASFRYISAKAPSFITTDAFGNPKQEFCYGEDVYIKIDEVDYNYAATYLDTWLDPNYSVDWYNGAGWNYDVKSGIYNYSQILRNKGQQPFKPVDDYYIKLAVNHPSCGWTESYAAFSYVCCDNGNLAQFDAEINTKDGIVSGSGNDLSAYGASHSFCIYTDVNNDGVYELVDCVSSSTFSFPFQEGVEYWIVHRVTTLCGDFCYVIHFSASPNFAKDGSSSFNCDNFPLPCNLSTPVANCPYFIFTGTGVSLVLSWSPVTSAVSYEFDIVDNDPTCGCKGGKDDEDGKDGIKETTILEGTEFQIPLTKSQCFSFKVRAKCKDGSFSKWSDLICYPSCENNLNNESDVASIRSRIKKEPSGMVELLPNPFNNQLMISLSGFESELLKIQITNLQGQLVKADFINPKLNDSYVWEPTSQIEPGIYLVTFTADNYIETKKVIYFR
jgi:hypothetical protein